MMTQIRLDYIANGINAAVDDVFVLKDLVERLQGEGMKLTRPMRGESLIMIV
jgi:hypothetical protein